MVDAFSTTWATVRDCATARVDSARARVMARGVEERDADFERGRAAAMQEILDLAKAGPRTL